ncbi:MAG: hypothetical protein FWD23_07445 [Oscillospiraceae bacterium]|nr:hypothetical protein [Oscillospiraceae bacterium]
MKKSKLTAIILAIIMITAMGSIFAVPTGAYDIIDIKVPIGEARVNGIVDPGEWDAATAIVLDEAVMIERAQPTPRRDDLPKGLSTSVKIKVKDGYLYFLEERANPWIKFYHDDPRFSYESNGGILWFFKDGEPHDLFYQAGTKSNPGAPAFCYRSENSNDNRVIIQADEGVTVVTPGVGSVMEAKIKLSLLGLTMADFENGLTMFHCTQQVWGEDYNDQWCPGLNDATLGFWEWACGDDGQQPGFAQTDTPTWGDSGDYVLVADTFDLAALLAAEAAAAEAAKEAEAAANAPAAAADEPAPAPAPTPAPASPAAPATGDPMAILAALSAVSASGVFFIRKKK